MYIFMNNTLYTCINKYNFNFSKMVIDTELSKNISHSVVVQNFTICTCLRMSTYTDFVNFLEEYNRYEAEIFSVYITFDELSYDITFVFVAQNFIICTCLRYVDIYCFCQFSRRIL